jgi:cation diffusion facilitator CzcD-associated flavoprotein CzcO
MANGCLQKPKLPGIEGITAFRGRAFHTSRWDYDYTGSDLATLSDKRVGIIGAGASYVASYRDCDALIWVELPRSEEGMRVSQSSATS